MDVLVLHGDGTNLDIRLDLSVIGQGALIPAEVETNEEIEQQGLLAVASRAVAGFVDLEDLLRFAAFISSPS